MHPEYQDSRITRALQRYRAGLARAFTPGCNLERFHDTQQVLAMAERLSEPEIHTLGIATEYREGGLKAARAGDLDEARALVNRAREVYSKATLSREAVECAETYQSAAESYIRYKIGDFAAAERSMRESLARCELLANEYGYPLETRRVHLARNIARVLASAGDTEEALRISVQLLEYIGGVEAAWPMPYQGPPRRVHLDDESVVFILDQVVAEIVRLLQPNDPAARTNLTAVARARDVLNAARVPAPVRRAAHCLTACAAWAIGDVDSFLDEAAAFFEGGRQSFDFTWRELEHQFLDLASLSRRVLGSCGELG
ncbi:hypothetical protein G3N57_02795 [Paraburkholderia sp. Se-20369]|nr:hypothetical protein [Paraburkholderia sp. Se-20369]